MTAPSSGRAGSGLSVAVVIPVGPGHQLVSARARFSVERAWVTNRGPFSHLDIRVVDDSAGLGRSQARNRGLSDPADWYFLLDADDQMMPGAFGLVQDAPATFGAIVLDGKPYKGNRWPVTRETLFEHGADGTLTMGCFIRGDVAARFNESLENGEDFDFYLRLPGFVKIQEPLVDIGYSTPSAGGKRKGAEGAWREACREVIRGYDFGLRPVLEAPEGAGQDVPAVSGALPGH